MATNAISALGTTLQFNGNTIGEVVSVSGSRSRTPIEVLSCDSTNQAVERIAGALDEGEMTFNIVYDQTAAGVYNDLNTDLQAGTIATATITYTDGSNTSTHSGSAMITSLDVPGFGSPNEAPMVSLTLTASGQFTFTDVA